ncbi:MAG: PD-(D/E)XK nuclease family protein [Paludibacteraceae bacterium]|nr:PD-(D/E)XK nuclease family protein [Paludibacteraceae bacterium]
MKIIYSPFFTSHQFVAMPDGQVMMDCSIVDTEGLLSLLELHLGIHSEVRDNLARVVDYYRLLRDYVLSHPTCVLAESFVIAGLSVARTCLQWRDELTLYGWSAEAPAPTERLQVLQSIEPDFAANDVCLGSRIASVTSAINEQPRVLAGSTIQLMVPLAKIAPRIREIIRSLQGVTIEDAQEWAMPSPTPDRLHVWHFDNEQAAFRYMASIARDAFDVWINADNKLMDNWLHMAGRPTAGSMLEADNNLVLQTLPLGIRLFQNPLNIKSLIDYLTLPVSPLEGVFRFGLANAVGSKCGLYNEECNKYIKDYQTGKIKSYIETKEEREQKVRTFLPCLEKQEEAGKVKRTPLLQYLAALQTWANQRAMMLQTKEEDKKLMLQLFQLAYLIDILRMLLQERTEDTIPYEEIEQLVAGLYEVSSSVQYYAETGCQEVVQTPADLVTDAQRILWFNPSAADAHQLSLNWLTSVERNALEQKIALWNQEDERQAYYQTLLCALSRAREEITLITVDKLKGEDNPISSLLLRMQSMTEDFEKRFFSTPEIAETFMEEVCPVNNAISQPYVEVTHRELIAERMRKKESASSLSNMIEYPLDYAFQYLAKISPLGSAVLPQLFTMEGTTAHAVIEKLFSPRDGESLQDMAQRVNQEYEKAFEEQVQAYGALFLLPENIIEQRRFHDKLKTCISNLAEILVENQLRVTHCERSMDDHLHFLEGEEDILIDGFIDFTLEDAQGNPVIFDFKWTHRKSYYQDLLRDNQSLQLALYAALLGEETKKTVHRTAYFLMPQGRLFSTSQFVGKHCVVIQATDTADLMPRIINSYRFRREELLRGHIETAEGVDGLNFDYATQQEAKNLFPLTINNDRKEANKVSDFSFLFNATES